ncbi:MAG: hypothetical protein M1830_010109 [Pleopsidium flavum]|nr:MAG: hypothetical protein M1830_010109 [Pleopsidium flavum]
MGCCGERERLGDVRAEQKWDYINLSDFRSTSCFTPLSYGVLYIFLLTSIAVYGVDTFTAVNLLVFDRWSGQIKPIIPFAISKWIFAVCIVLSWIFLVYRWIRALRAMKSGSVAASYLDPLAVRIQSIRMGKTGRGWRRFLVFAELTKSKKGAEYVALFTYFSFEAWMRIVFAEGPRQVINALTLYSVMQLNLIPAGKHAANDGHTPIAQFFVNVQLLANSNKQQAVILFSMLFTLIIWVISALSLAIASLMYILFLWHHIPSADGGLSGYCRRKIDSRLSKIVGVKVKKALENDNSIRRKGGAGTANVDGGRPSMKRQPTVPLLQTCGEDRLPEMPMLSRQTTQATRLFYSTGPPMLGANPVTGLQRQPTGSHTPMVENRPLPPSRSATQSSAYSDASYASNAPLIGRASSIGYGPPLSSISAAPLLPYHPTLNGDDQRPPLNRIMTRDLHNIQRSYTPDPKPLPSQASRVPPEVQPPSRQNTGRNVYEPAGRRTPDPSPTDIRGRGTLGQYKSATDFDGSRTPGSFNSRRTPPAQYEMRSQTQANTIKRLPTNGSYVAFNPDMHASPIKAHYGRSGDNLRVRPPYRNLTDPNQSEYFNQPSPPTRPPQRSGTAPLPQSTTYDDSIYDSYYRTDNEFERPPMPLRAATAGPAGGTGAWNVHGRAAPGSYHGNYGRL